MDKQQWAIQRMNERKILQMYPEIKRQSGIYGYFRIDIKTGERCFYVGQAVDLIARLAGHLMGYKRKNASHIDKSLYVHGFTNGANNTDKWWVKILAYAPKSELDILEQKYINLFLEKYEKCYNITGGGQIDKAEDVGKRLNTKLKSYANGKNNGYEKARAEIANLFEKYLTFDVRKNNKLSQRAKEKFEKFLKGSENET